MAYRLGFIMEQTLGHVTHAKNLQECIAKDADVVPTWIPLTFDIQDRWDRVPLIKGNWTLRASIRARAQLREALRSTQLDGLFFHTSVTALFSWRLMADIPTVVSMDATPLNFDSIGSPYNHRPSSLTAMESIWKPAHGVELERAVRLLFVGGDFRRKGGDTLLQAFRGSLMQECELDIVTREQVDIQGLTGVRVHHGLGSNAPGLMELYARADIFVFPTQADVLPIVIMEAFASGLPVITTDVGAVREQIEDGVTGFLVPPRDADAMAQAILRLVRNPELRGKMSSAVRRVADEKFNAAKNYNQVLAVCKQCVDVG